MNMEDQQMYCIHCGKELPQGKFCPGCGKQQGSTAPPSPAEKPSTLPYAPPPSYPAQPPPAYTPPPPPAYAPPCPAYPVGPHEYKTIGGVLRLLQVGMILTLVLTPLILIFDFATFWGVTLVLELISTAMMGLTAVSTIMLLRRNPKFLTVFHVVWFASFAWTIVRTTILIVQQVIYGGEFLALFTGMFSIWGIIMSVVVFFLWRMYYTRSVRVRTYMGSDTYVTQCPFTKNVTPPQPAVPDDAGRQNQQGYY